MSDVDANFELDLVDEQLAAQLEAHYSQEDGLDQEEPAGTTAAAPPVINRPAAVHPKANLPCMTEKELDAFHDLMADPSYPNNKKLLNAPQRTELISLLKDSDFKQSKDADQAWQPTWLQK